MKFFAYFGIFSFCLTLRKVLLAIICRLENGLDKLDEKHYKNQQKHTEEQKIGTRSHYENSKTMNRIGF